MFKNSFNVKIKNIIILQFVIVIYTLTGIMAKIASKYTFVSKKFIFYYMVEILILGIYSIFWQQIIKRFDISIAYANRSAAMFWSLLWSIIIFKESITLKNIIGIGIIVFGIIVVNGNE